MIAEEAKYHAKCLVALYNKAARFDTNSDSDGTDGHLHSMAFAQLVPIFELASLVDLYATRLSQLGASVRSRIHSTVLYHKI